MKKTFFLVLSIIISINLQLQAQVVKIGTTTLNSGAKGSNGLSAYDVAVNDGFVGDETAWLTSLGGADGADGATGAAGAGEILLGWACSNREGGKIVIDMVNKNIIIPQYGVSIVYSDDFDKAGLVADQVLDYSALSSLRTVILYFNATTELFAFTDELTGYPVTSDKLYFVTAFSNHTATDAIIVPSFNTEAIEVVPNSGIHAPINWTALGDSHTDDGVVWLDKVTEYFGGSRTSYNSVPRVFNYTNMGVSGAHIKNNGATSYYQRFVTSDAMGVGGSAEGCDLLTIFGGGNDGTSNLGTIATGTFDDTTTIGALQAIIEYAYGVNPQVRIFLISPPASFVSATEDKRTLIADAISDVGDYYNLPVLRFNESSGFNIINYSQYLSDSLHMNDFGKEVFANQLYQFIKNNY